MSSSGGSCDACGKASESLSRCARCQTARYCSRECQKADWKTHKSRCAAPSDAAQASPQPSSAAPSAASPAAPSAASSALDGVDLNAVHASSMHNSKALRSSSTCGCFFCLATYSPRDVVSWTDGGSTALCPRCGIDSVIGSSSGWSITDELLKRMKQKFFDAEAQEKIAAMNNKPAAAAVAAASASSSSAASKAASSSSAKLSKSELEHQSNLLALLRSIWREDTCVLMEAELVSKVGSYKAALDIVQPSPQKIMSYLSPELRERVTKEYTVFYVKHSPDPVPQAARKQVRARLEKSLPKELATRVEQSLLEAYLNSHSRYKPALLDTPFSPDLSNITTHLPRAMLEEVKAELGRRSPIADADRSKVRSKLTSLLSSADLAEELERVVAMSLVTGPAYHTLLSSDAAFHDSIARLLYSLRESEVGKRAAFALATKDPIKDETLRPLMDKTCPGGANAPPALRREMESYLRARYPCDQWLASADFIEIMQESLQGNTALSREMTKLASSMMNDPTLMEKISAMVAIDPSGGVAQLSPELRATFRAAGVEASDVIESMLARASAAAMESGANSKSKAKTKADSSASASAGATVIVAAVAVAAPHKEKEKSAASSSSPEPAKLSSGKQSQAAEEDTISPGTRAVVREMFANILSSSLSDELEAELYATLSNARYYSLLVDHTPGPGQVVKLLSPELAAKVMALLQPDSIMARDSAAATRYRTTLAQSLGDSLAGDMLWHLSTAFDGRSSWTAALRNPKSVLETLKPEMEVALQNRFKESQQQAAKGKSGKGKGKAGKQDYNSWIISALKDAGKAALDGPAAQPASHAASDHEEEEEESDDDDYIMRCDYCARDMQSALRCLACHAAFYCDRSCRNRDRERHEDECRVSKFAFMTYDAFHAKHAAMPPRPDSEAEDSDSNAESESEPDEPDPSPSAASPAAPAANGGGKKNAAAAEKPQVEGEGEGAKSDPAKQQPAPSLSASATAAFPSSSAAAKAPAKPAPAPAPLKAVNGSAASAASSPSSPPPPAMVSPSAASAAGRGAPAAAASSSSSLADSVAQCHLSSCGRRGVKLQLCAKCFAVQYCSTKCQQTDWKNHREMCAIIAATL